ncbi:hypothetical protein MSAN_01463900 [Mycena sanguinolenta]|uniref:Uncharacterized protein n=1 Tax=Mycena sanguinolenta TaxID=230812 RepID=A0A8H6YB29_9AGAR|nr:hypothetical protein MSAN_01463900 [Mycena sanguinolenta]
MSSATSGVEFYNARRAQWLTPPVPPPTRPPGAESSSSRRKLEQVLSAPDALTSDDVWFGSVEKIWKGLGAGGRLKRRLPMRLVVCRPLSPSAVMVNWVQIKIIHASWLRDETWPANQVAPEPDDELPPELLVSELPLPPAPVIQPTSATSSGISTPWTLVGGEDDREGDAS